MTSLTSYPTWPTNPSGPCGAELGWTCVERLSCAWASPMRVKKVVEAGMGVVRDEVDEVRVVRVAAPTE